MLRILQTTNKKDLEMLRKVSEEVSIKEIKTPEFQQFLDNLVYTAQNTKTEEGWDSAGLAAIQVGKAIRVFCFLKENGGFDIMINPEIKEITDNTDIQTEACLSIPKTVGNVERLKKIKVTYLDRNGNRKKERFSNWEAREIQHEYDHLEGILFTDKLA
jgi:peptide deformylase